MKKIITTLKNTYSKIKKLVIEHKKISIASILILLLLIVGSFFLFSSKTKNNTVSYRAVKITRGNLTQTIDVVGNVEAIPSVILTWQTGGVVGKVNRKVGDQVNAGGTIISLQDESLPASILQAKADLLTAELDLEKLKVGNPDLDAATQALADAQYNFKIKQINRDYYITTGASDEKIAAGRQAYDLANNAYLTAKNEYDALVDKPQNDPDKLKAAEKLRNAILERNSAIIHLTNIIGHYWNYGLETVFNNYEIAKTTLAQAKVTWEKLYNNKAAYLEAAQANVQALTNTINSAKIIAPFSGTITDIFNSSGELVSSGTEAVQLDDLKNLLINVSISEVDVNKLAVGQEAIITFSAIPNKTYQGMVTKIGNAGSSSSGVVQFNATIQLVDADDSVKPGFSAMISIVTNKAEDVLMIPSMALMTDNSGKSYVLMELNGKMTPVSVEAGLISDEYVELKSGNLKEGDTLYILLTSSNADTASNRAMFGIMGGLGGGGERPPQNQPNRDR